MVLHTNVYTGKYRYPEVREGGGEQLLFNKQLIKHSLSTLTGFWGNLVFLGDGRFTICISFDRGFRLHIHCIIVLPYILKIKCCIWQTI